MLSLLFSFSVSFGWLVYIFFVCPAQLFGGFSFSDSLLILSWGIPCEAPHSCLHVLCFLIVCFALCRIFITERERERECELFLRGKLCSVRERDWEFALFCHGLCFYCICAHIFMNLFCFHGPTSCLCLRLCFHDLLRFYFISQRSILKYRSA